MTVPLLRIAGIARCRPLAVACPASGRQRGVARSILARRRFGVARRFRWSNCTPIRSGRRWLSDEEWNPLTLHWSVRACRFGDRSQLRSPVRTCRTSHPIRVRFGETVVPRDKWLVGSSIPSAVHRAEDAWMAVRAATRRLRRLGAPTHVGPGQHDDAMAFARVTSVALRGGAAEHRGWFGGPQVGQKPKEASGDASRKRAG